MKKTMKFALLICLVLLACVLLFTACDNGTVEQNNTTNENTSETQKDEISVSEDGFLVVNGVKTEYAVHTSNDTAILQIIKQEVKDGKLWITYKDDPNNPICVGEFDNSQMATEGLEYCLQNDGTYWIAVGSAKNIENIVVPSTYNGKTVTGIMRNAFSNCTNVKSITLPNTIKTIDQNAFNNCGLRYIELPEGLETIGNNAFGHCFNLFYASIPSSITTIGEEVFYLCENLIELCNNTSYEIQIDRYYYQTPLPIRHVISDKKDSFLSIENDFVFFRDATETILCGYIGQSTELILPSTETYSVHTNAFYNCNKITKIVIPSNIVSIEDSAFQYCSNVTEIIINVGVISIKNHAFWGLDKASITYSGTRGQWQQIEQFSQSTTHNTDCPIPVHCCDDIE